MSSAQDSHKTVTPGQSDVRRRILEAALGCFSASGFHSTSMQQICAAAQMSPGGVYRYFASKDDIIIAIAEHVQSRNGEYFGRMAAEGANLDTFSEVGFSCLRDMMRGPECGLFCEVLAEAQRNPTIRIAFEQSFNRTRIMLREVLSTLQRVGEIDRALDVDVVSSMLMAITDGLLMRLRLDPTLNFEELWPAFSELIHRMLTPGAAGTSPAIQSKVHA